MVNLVDKIMDWESGEMDQEEAVAFFQELIDNGMAWTLQGCYGRNAQALIEAGLCYPKKA
jgi:polyhydroxyalkanoate synthesis regulator phasin